MTADTEFTNEMDRLIERAAHQRLREFSQGESAMRELELLHGKFDCVADVVHAAILRPRIDVLAARFEHATADHFGTPDGLHSCCTFEPTPGYPARAFVSLSVVLDSETRSALVLWDARIVPPFLELDRQDALRVALSPVPWPDVVAWVEQKLVRFLASYLTVQFDERYQQNNVYTDPVCGMSVSVGTAMEFASYQGTVYFFCASACRERFQANPALFVEGLIGLPAGSRSGSDRETSHGSGMQTDEDS